MNRMSDAAIAVCAWAQTAGTDARHALSSSAERRLSRLRTDDERGAQAAEYAMLGGVSAAACGALVIILREPDRLSGLVDAVVQALSGAVGSWF